MKKRLLFTVMAIFMVVAGYSQNLWTKISEERVASLAKVDRASMPREYQIFQLNYEALKVQLQSAPSRGAGDISNVIITFPNSNGKLEKFRMYEASVLEPELAARHPELQSYVGQGVDNPSSSVYLSTTIFGLHSVTRSVNGTTYIDPYTANLQNYIVFDRNSRVQARQFGCQVADENTSGRADDASASNLAFANDGLLRTYRLAMACTVQYAAFHITAANADSGTLAEKKAAVLNAMGVSIVRLNSVYEREMSVRMVLVANNENIIYVGNDDEDPFTNSPQMINEIQPIVDAAIGVGNYDMGHGFCTTDSGIAQVASVCGTGKARGITGQPNPVGDTFDIDYVAHEMGHQFGATHTQNNACNRSAGTAVEPGSASTIMGYAGICAPNVQTNSDDYFHAVSLAQMFSFVTSGGTCSVNTSNGNAAPTITPLTNYTIPAGTPFILKGNGADTNGDALTYCWEQTDAGATTAVPSATSAAANPNFRSVAPSTSTDRYIPSLPNVIANNFASTWEVLPTVNRTMNFALTVRDNKLNGGQTARQNMTVTFDAANGPFAVTSQAADGVSYTQNSTQTVTWNVAGTTAAPFNSPNVNILLSTDGGLTFPTVLASNTPNDGTQTVTIPDVAAPFCRIMVQSVGNIFYALNTKAFAIGYTVTNNCVTYSNANALPIPDGVGPNAGGAVVASTIAIPDNVTISDVNVNVNVAHTFFWDLVVSVAHPDGTQVNLLNRNCNNVSTGFNITFNDGAPAVVCSSNVTGTYSPAAPLSVLNGKQANGNWQLLLRDFYNGDTGILNSWSVEICYQQAVLNTQNFSLKDFKIYPNPNNGNFNVQFDSQSGNQIKVGVYDIRGRQIFDQTFENTGLFSQNLELNDAQSGVYMVTVQDGDKKETRKIVIQ